MEKLECWSLHGEAHQDPSDNRKITHRDHPNVTHPLLMSSAFSLAAHRLVNSSFHNWYSSRNRGEKNKAGLLKDDFDDGWPAYEKPVIIYH
jgi:hypothetical protein